MWAGWVKKSGKKGKVEVRRPLRFEEQDPRLSSSQSSSKKGQIDFSFPFSFFSLSKWKKKKRKKREPAKEEDTYGKNFWVLMLKPPHPQNVNVNISAVKEQFKGLLHKADRWHLCGLDTLNTKTPLIRRPPENKHTMTL